MFFDQGFLTAFWAQLLLPLLRILLLVSLGLVVANFIEFLNWTHRLAVLSRPLIRMGRLSAITGASFSMAFFSGVSANTMLAEAFDKGKLDKRELVLANLFNSLPRFFLHLPTVFFLTAPLIKGAAFIYVGITFSAAVLQTVLVVISGRLLLPLRNDFQDEDFSERPKNTWRMALNKSIKRFRKRIPRLLSFMVPVYVLFFFLGRYGVFEQIEKYVANKAWFLAWLDPQSLGIVILHVTAEFSAGLAAASALLANNSLDYKDVVLALLAGNVLSAPIRAIRHQFPYYVGIFPPKIAMELVGISQVFRLACIMVIGLLYYNWPVSG
ncbi:MAG: hypothetical protein OEM01_08875 [Desulfobulbaceae bacterium]|nr:hypothetical protein [Desulfobulbaceae bacterium]